jgi:hypothetical protein
MPDRTLGLLNATIEDLKGLLEDYETITKVGHTQRVARDDASDRQSNGVHSDPTGVAVTDMAACRRHTKDFEKELRRALYAFLGKLGPAYDSLHKAFKAADRRPEERSDNRIRL